MKKHGKRNSVTNFNLIFCSISRWQERYFVWHNQTEGAVSSSLRWQIVTLPLFFVFIFVLRVRWCPRRIK